METSLEKEIKVAIECVNLFDPFDLFVVTLKNWRSVAEQATMFVVICNINFHTITDLILNVNKLN